MGDSKALLIDRKESIADLNKSGKSCGAISKQSQVQRSTIQTTVSIKFKAQLCNCQNQEEITNCHLQLRENGISQNIYNIFLKPPLLLLLIILTNTLERNGDSKIS